MTTALEGREGSALRPGHSLLPGKTRYPLYRSLGGPQGRSGRVRKISPPPVFELRAVQPAAETKKTQTKLTTTCNKNEQQQDGKNSAEL